MATKTDFTAEEWNLIRRAPFMAGLVMVAASPSGPFGIVKEMFAVGKILADVKNRGTSSDLAKAIVADLETAEGRQQSVPAEFQGKAPEQRWLLLSTDGRRLWPALGEAHEQLMVPGAALKERGGQLQQEVRQRRTSVYALDPKTGRFMTH